MCAPYGVGKSSPERFQIILAQTPQRSFQRGLAGTHATPAPNCAHNGSHGETGAASDGGRYHYPRTVSHGSEPLRAQRSEEHTLPSLHGSRERRREAESLRNGDAHRARLRSEASRPRWDALLCCWFLRYTGKLRGSLSLHPRVERKICCWGCLVFACGVGDSSLVTAVRFLNRCLRRSMRGTCPSEQRSGRRF